MAFNNTYKGKKVLITGNTGFKGSWLSTWLIMLGADVYGYSKDVPTEPSMFQTLNLKNKIHHRFDDIRDKEALNLYIQQVKPDFIFHLAAQAIVSISYEKPFDTVTTNVVGTTSVLEAIRNITWRCTCILITSDKVYNNVEWVWGYRETDPLGGKDIYSGSKGAAEMIIRSYWRSFISNMPNIKLAVARAGNVIGGGDWAKDRIVVDCIKAFSQDKIVEIRSPKSTRPWQHVMEPLSGYLALGWYLYDSKCQNGEAFNFGPCAEQTKSVYELSADLANLWGKSNLVKIIDDIPFKEASLLKLNCDKALACLNWHSTLNYPQCVFFIIEWYKSYYSNENEMYKITCEQISRYITFAAEQKIIWAL